MRPPCSWTILRVVSSPRPVPLPPFGGKKSREDLTLGLPVHSATVIYNFEYKIAGFLAGTQHNLAAGFFAHHHGRLCHWRLNL